MNNSQKGFAWLWVLVIVGIVILGGGIYFLFFGVPAGPTSVVKQQLVYFKSGDNTKAYGLASDNFKSITTQDLFTTTNAKYSLIKNYTKYAIEEEKIVDSRACAEVTLANDTQYLVIFYGLTKQNKNWKISSMQIGPRNQLTCSVLLKSF